MPEPSPLTAEQTATLRATLATGKQPTVWFTQAAVGVEAGRSGKVTALAEPAEGDFIQVRPTGSKDVLSFEAAEVTMTKPPRQRKSTTATASATASAAASTPDTARPADAIAPGTPAWSGAPSAESPKAPEPATRSPTDSAAGSTAGVRTATGSSPAGSGAASAASATGSGASRSAGGTRAVAASRPAASTSARRSTAGESATASGTGTAARPARSGAATRRHKPVDMTVTLSGTVDGEWTIDVLAGKKRVARAQSLSPAVVAKVAKVLPPDIEDAIDAALDAARDQQRTRVEKLESELADAKRALDDLFG